LNRVPYDHVGSSDDEMVELLMMPRRMWARRCASLTFCTAFFLFWLLVVKARNCLSAACGKGEELLLLGKLALKMLWAEQHGLYVFAYCKVLPAYAAVFRSQIDAGWLMFFHCKYAFLAEPHGLEVFAICHVL
jgi:hypothetical protein